VKANGGTAQLRTQILAHQVKLKLLRPPTPDARLQRLNLLLGFKLEL
jgi:hypothetical protein